MYKVAIVGPESTGKSVLAEALAMKLKDAVVVPEYARIYLEENGAEYNFETLDIIAKGQAKLIEEKSKSQAQWLIIDTEYLVMKIWSEFVFGKLSECIETLHKTQRFDYYLLCDIDLAWEEDPLREHPTQRAELFQLYKKELDLMEVSYAIIRGQGEERIQHALKVLNSYFYNEPSK